MVYLVGTLHATSLPNKPLQVTQYFSGTIPLGQVLWR